MCTYLSFCAGISLNLLMLRKYGKDIGFVNYLKYYVINSIEYVYFHCFPPSPLPSPPPPTPLGPQVTLSSSFG